MTKFYKPEGMPLQDLTEILNTLALEAQTNLEHILWSSHQLNQELINESAYIVLNNNDRQFNKTYGVKCSPEHLPAALSLFKHYMLANISGYSVSFRMPITIEINIDNTLSISTRYTRLDHPDDLHKNGE